MGESSPFAVLAELSHCWSPAERTQRWRKHLEVLWDHGGPWVQAGLHVPSHPASLAGHQRLCRDVHADLRLQQKCCLVFGLSVCWVSWVRLFSLTPWTEHLQRKIISFLANNTLFLQGFEAQTQLNIVWKMMPRPRCARQLMLHFNQMKLH